MLFKIPVIATNYSGHLNFCNDDNSFLINYRLEPSKTHIQKEWKLENSLWAEPDKEHLKSLMRFVYENRTSDIIKNKTEKANEAVKKLTWKKTAEDVHEVLNALEKKTRVKVGIVSTFNTKCGVAEYTKYLIENLKNRIDFEILANYENIRSNEENGIELVRCWTKYHDDLDKLYQQIKDDKLKIVHFQFNFGLFKLKPLMLLIQNLKQNNVKIILTFHSVEDVDHDGKIVSLIEYKNEIKSIDRIWVHTIRDLEFLSKMGIEKNVVCIPQGIKKFPNNYDNTIQKSIFNNNIIISSFGFLLPNKGILEIIESLPILQKSYPDILFLAVNAIYPYIISDLYFETCKKRVKELGLSKKVIFFKEYLEEEEIIELLRYSDMIVMPYKETKESSSAAIRFAFSSKKPIIATNVPIFEEFRNEVFTIENCTPKNIAKGIMYLKENKELQEKLIVNIKGKIEEQSWDNIAKIYEKMIEELV